MRISGKDIKLEGRLIRIARLDGDKYKFLDDPESVIDGLRKSDARADIFTFMQKVPDRTPIYAYPMEWDNLAVLSISTFENWWAQQLGFKARNKAKQAGKKGVVVREMLFDDALVKGIW